MYNMFPLMVCTMGILISNHTQSILKLPSSKTNIKSFVPIIDIQ